MRSLFLLLLIVCTALAQVPNQRVNTLTATAGITNNGVYKHPTGASAGFVFTSDAAGHATWQSLAASGDSLWTNNTSGNSAVVYLKAYPTNFQIRPLWTNGAMLTLGVYTTNWFDGAFGDPKQYYSILSARDVQRGDVDRNNFWFSTSLDTVGSVYGSIDGSTRTNFSLLTVEAVGMPNGGTRRVQAGYDGTGTLLSVVGESGSTIITDGNTLVGTSITNLGRYQHTNGAFTGGIFISTNVNGDAAWRTNLGNIIISNSTLFSTLISNAFINQAFITNLFTTGGSVGASLWTNDGVVLRPKPTNGEIPNFALRGGTLSNSLVFTFAERYWDTTNVGKYSIAWGTNVMARGDGSISFGGNNIVQTNAHYSSIVGGSNNVIGIGSHLCHIGSGTSNTIATDNFFTTVLGGFRNGTVTLVDYGVIAGGQDNVLSADHSFIGAGAGNTVISGAIQSFMGAGNNNILRDDNSILVGGELNQTRGDYCFIGGGRTNKIFGAAGVSDYSIIVGGQGNEMGLASTSGSLNSFIGGGFHNRILQDNINSVIVGGRINFIGANITNCFIGGGFNNAIADNAQNGAILGGEKNLISNAGDFGAIIGTSNQVAAFMSIAIGGAITNSASQTVDIGHNDFSKTSFGISSNNFRTNTVFSGVVSYRPNATAQSLAAGTAITHFQAKVRVVGSGGAVTITAAPTVTDGQDGDWLLILGTDDTNTVTVQDQDTLASSNLHLGAATRLLGNRDTLLLSFDATDSTWHEVAFTNN